MREACRRAQALDIIERNPEGFNATRRRARPAALRRRAPAPLDRARAAQESADPDSRRGHERARRDHRSQGAGGARRGHEGPHHLRDRAPARHHPQRHPHPGVRGRPHHRERQFRRAGAPGRHFAELAKTQFIVRAAQERRAHDLGTSAPPAEPASRPRPRHRQPTAEADQNRPPRAQARASHARSSRPEGPTRGRRKPSTSAAPGCSRSSRPQRRPC